MYASGNESGFSLIEVLVALAILALGLAAILESVTAGLKTAARAGDLVRATLEAQSRLASTPVDTAQTVGRRGGTFHQGRWEMDVTVAGDGLALVALTVYAGRESVRLTTLRPLAAR